MLRGSTLRIPEVLDAHRSRICTRESLKSLEIIEKKIKLNNVFGYRDTNCPSLSVFLARKRSRGHTQSVVLFLLPLHSLGSARQPAGRAHFRAYARHLVQGILPFIHFLTRSNETVFGHVPEWCVLASAALCLTIHPSLFRAFFPPHLCASGSAGARFISEARRRRGAPVLVVHSAGWVTAGGKRPA